MKLKALVALIALALAGASLAYAAPKSVSKNGPPTTTGTTTHGKKPPKTGEGVCRPRVSLILKGTLYSVATDKTSFVMYVTGGSHLAKKTYKKSYVSVAVDASTKFNRNGHHSIDALVPPTDRLVVRTRAVCKADYAPNGTLPSLTAKRVTAHPKKTTS